MLPFVAFLFHTAGCKWTETFVCFFLSSHVLSTISQQYRKFLSTPKGIDTTTTIYN